ncbi:MAG: hotdog fold thioesterase [Verrucomicrobiaceae bacterium]|jgi:acyl-CoA thioesterase|nr:hotdog fold thioesterase [Verrucomicrobiaceae bacterium]
MPNTDNDRFAKELGFRVVSTSVESASVVANVQERFLNGVDIAHGGFIFTLCDYAVAVASNTDERIAISSGATIDYIEPIPPNCEVCANVKPIVITQKSGVYNVVISASENPDKKFAVFSCRMIFKAVKHA